MAKLAAFTKDLTGIDEKYHDLYSPVGDKEDGSEGYVLDLEDKDFKSKLGEFRDNNTTLLKQEREARDALKRFDGIDPDKAREAEEKLQQISDKKLLEAGKVEELVTQRTERMRQDHDGQVKALQEERDKAADEAVTFRTQLKRSTVESAVQTAISKVATVRVGAMRDLLQRAHDTWTMNEGGTLVAMEGEKVLYGKKGDNPLTVDEYAERLVGEAPHLFDDSSGGGSPGSDKGKPSKGGAQTIAVGDNKAFLANLDDIASGKTQVGEAPD